VEGRTNLFSFFENSRFCRSDSETESGHDMRLSEALFERMGAWESVSSIILFRSLNKMVIGV
jgi:hypothetical protein